jgi:Smg protein
MKENVLDILMYLFEHCLDSEGGAMPDEKVLRDHLDNAGFPNQDVDKAFNWLEALSIARERQFSQPSDRSIRVFCPEEIARLDAECRGFLVFLEQTGVLDPVARELIIDRAMALDTRDIDLPQLKWVILMVLFNQPGHEAAFAWMEDLIFDEVADHLH